MVNERARVQSSAAISMSAHGMLLGLYLLMRTTSSQNQPLLTRVEFLDLKPAPAEARAPGAAEQTPRGIKEFLRMALPQSRPAPSAPQEAQPMEAPQEQSSRSQRADNAPALKIDASRTLRHESSIRIRNDQAAPLRGASFSDISVSAGAAPSSDLTDVKVKPDIRLDAVGRRAGRAPSGGSIRIDPNAGSPRAADLRDVSALSSAGAAGASGTAQAEPGIRLLDEGGPARPGRISAPVIGYGRGGGGLSLQEHALARPTSAKLPEEEPTRKSKEDQPILKLNHGGAVEIAGPLAKRKIVKMSLPRYPDWAKEQGIEAEISVRFFVSPEGEVRDQVLLDRTSGYEELDQLCMAEIKKWLFVALQSGNGEGDQWGVITFRFRLK